MPASSPRALFTAVVILATCIVAPAQLAPWSSIPAASSQNVQLEQSLAVVTQGNTVHAFSALTKTWTSVTALFGPPANTLLNEHLIVRDGPIFHGYSPRTGLVPVTLRVVAVPDDRQLRDPADLAQHRHRRQLPPRVLRVQRTVDDLRVPDFPDRDVRDERPVLLPRQRGSERVYGVSSFYGSLVPAPAAGATATGAWGNVGIATSTGLVHGFSASRGTWASMAAAATPAITTGNAQPAFVAINDGAAMSMFSGHTGTFTTLSAPPSSTLDLERYVAIAVDGTTSTPIPRSSEARPRSCSPRHRPSIKQQMYALVDDGMTPDGLQRRERERSRRPSQPPE